MIETGPLHAPLCGVTEPPREWCLPCHGQTARASWPTLRVVLFHVAFLGGLACVVYVWPALRHAPPHATPMALSRNSPVAIVESTGELRESPGFFQWLEQQVHQLFVSGREWYFAMWSEEGYQICHHANITSNCCDQIQGGIKDVRWTIYHVTIFAFALGLLLAWCIYEVGYYTKPRSPGYWTNRPLNPFNDSFLEEVDVTQELKDAVQELFDLTTDPRRMGKGRDGSFVKHKGFKVTKVTRIENGHLWTGYMHAVLSTVRRTPWQFMKKMSGQLKVDAARALHIIDKHNEKIRSKEAACSFVDSLQLRRRFNETLLFHACPDHGARDPETGELRFGGNMSPLEVVKKTGLDDRVGSASGMLGSGTYFADMASKADQYAGKYGQPDDSTVGEQASMFLARVALGCPYLSQTSLEQMRRPPCREGHFDQNLLWSSVKNGKPWHEKELQLRTCDHRRFDSVMSDRKVDGGAKLYHEYVVYAKQCYPEFCVTYTRMP